MDLGDLERIVLGFDDQPVIRPLGRFKSYLPPARQDTIGIVQPFSAR